MIRTILGLLSAAITAMFLYLLARNHYSCPYCGKAVRWRNLVCPHCGLDM